MAEKHRWLILVLLAGLALTEIHQLLKLKWPEIIDPTVRPNLFIDKKAVPEGQTIAWYIKDTASMIFMCMWPFVLARLTFNVHKKLFYSSVAFFIYFVFDMYMYWWNFKSSEWAYLTVYVLMGVVFVIWVLPLKDKPVMKKVE